jgi:hypothetical protein
MSDEKIYWVENEQGGYAEKYTFEEACEIAKTSSIESSCLMMVKHQTGYVPARIYYCGHIYEQVEKGKNES